MPGEVIDRPNPPAAPSNLPDNVLSLAVELEKPKLDKATSEGLSHFRRASDYIAACEISYYWSLWKQLTGCASYDILA